VFLDLYGVVVQEADFEPFGGQGEVRFLSGVAGLYAVPGFDVAAAKQAFFDTYINRYCGPGAAIGIPGALELVRACRAAGLKTAVASSAERVKVDANLRAAGFDGAADFDAIMSAGSVANLKPAPDVFLAAAAAVGVPPSGCVVVEDAAAGAAAARAAGMRLIGVCTSMSEAEMAGSVRPDLLRADIGGISLPDLIGLRRRL
jgi:beta-phosphoglucomutase-like phosphatase (HAD superfamily)